MQARREYENYYILGNPHRLPARFVVWRIPGRMRLNTGSNSPASGAVDFSIFRLNIKTGEYHVHGPKSKLP